LVALVFTVILLLLGGVWLVLGNVAAMPGLPDAAGAPAHRASPSDRGVIIACVGIGPDAEGYCERYARDILRRGQLTDRQRALGEAAREAIWGAIASAAGPGPGPRCILLAPTVPPTGRGPYVPPPCHAPPRQFVPGDVDRLRQALAAAGFPDPIVRMARGDDPAPSGSILYAVPVGVACLVGSQSGGLEGNGTGPNVVGRLPDGSCLAG
jgi:hypothetical protein